MNVREIAIGQTFALGGPERLDTARIRAFAAAGGDESPAHFSDAEARAVGFPRALAHGMLGMAMLGRLITDHFPQSRMRAFGARFVAMTFHDDVLTCTATVESIDATAKVAHLALLAVKQTGQVVLTGTATVSIE